MLRNYLLTAWRHLLRHRLHTAINVIGLAVGLAFCVLVLAFVEHERSYDDFHAHGDRLFRLEGVEIEDGQEHSWPYHALALGPMLEAELPGIEAAVRLEIQGGEWGMWAVRRGERLADEPVIHADPSFLQAFTFPLVAGNPSHALDQPDDVVLSRRAAERWFGDESPVGQVLELGRQGQFRPYRVTAVVEVPTNSSIQFGLVTSMANADVAGYEDFYQQGFWTYVLLRPGVDPTAVADQVHAIVDRRLAETGHPPDHTRGQSLHRLVPIAQVHWDSQIRRTSLILTAIAGMVLLVATINFMGVAVGLAATRSREVGVRKALGARRLDLARQIWGEASLTVAAALTLGLGLAELLRPVFCSLIGQELAVPYGRLWPGLVALAVLVTAVAGAYPALLLSSLNPARVLRGRVRVGGPASLGPTLVVLQLALSVGLTAAAIVMAGQMRWLAGRDLGYQGEGVVIVQMGLNRTYREDCGRVLQAYRDLAARDPSILSVTGAEGTLTGRPGSSTYTATPGGGELKFYHYFAADGYLPTLGIKLVEGRDFRPGPAGEPFRSILVNQALVRAMGWKQGVGQEFPYLDGGKTVVGVVGDFHFYSLRQEVEPAIIQHGPTGNYPFLYVRCAPGALSACVASLRQEWQRVMPGYAFRQTFLDEDVARLYERERRWTQVLEWSAGMAVVIACFGAFGLTSLALVRRTRELGIRKAVGASVAALLRLLSRQYLVQAVLATLVAWPLAQVAVTRWLEQFAYRAPLGPGPFLLAGGGILLMVLATVAYQCLRAARANPVDALRCE
jgi:hypothetical protein